MGYKKKQITKTEKYDASPTHTTTSTMSDATSPNSPKPNIAISCKELDYRRQTKKHEHNSNHK